MEMAMIILKQTLVMALYMAGGYVLFKGGKITLEGSRTLANTLLWLIIPVVLVRSLCVECTPEKVAMLWQSFLLSTLAMALSIGMSLIIFRKSPLDCFSAAFSNCGFIGIPLVTAAFDESVVFFLCGMLIWVNVLQWTWGSAYISGRKATISPKGILLAPFTLSTLLGLFLFLTGLGAKLPSVVQDAMSGIAGLNGPIAMLVLGVYLAQTKLSRLFLIPRLYWISIVRMWIIPLVTLFFFWLLPLDRTMCMTVLISAAAPVGANAAVYAQMYDADYPYACQTVALSTVASIVMMPLFIMVATAVLGM
ncbi:MAG: AEC family transporter [bacterium]|nr:AEC family transporter [bacterium]